MFFLLKSPSWVPGSPSVLRRRTTSTALLLKGPRRCVPDWKVSGGLGPLAQGHVTGEFHGECRETAGGRELAPALWQGGRRLAGISGSFCRAEALALHLCPHLHASPLTATVQRPLLSSPLQPHAMLKHLNYVFMKKSDS